MNMLMKWRLMIFYVILFSLNSLCTAFVSAMQGQQWGALNSTEHAIIIAVIIGNWTGTLLALFNKTFARTSDLPVESVPDPKPPGPAPSLTKPIEPEQKG